MQRYHMKRYLSTPESTCGDIYKHQIPHAEIFINSLLYANIPDAEIFTNTRYHMWRYLPTIDTTC